MRGCVTRFAALVALSGSALLAACAGGASAPTVSLRDDNFRPYREYTTGQRTVRVYPNTLMTELVARVDRKTGAAKTLLVADFRYWGTRMRKYESARNASAEALTFEQISRHRSCEKGDCLYDEQFTVEIPESDLRRAEAGGYPLKVFAREGSDTTLAIQKPDIERLFAALDKPSPQAAAPTN